MQKNAELDRVLQDLADKGLTFDLLLNLSPEDLAQLPIPDGPFKQAQLLMIKAAVARASKEVRGAKRKSEGNEEETEAAVKKYPRLSEADQEEIERLRAADRNRKQRVSEVMGSILRTVTVSAQEVQQMILQLSSLGSILDICFCMDATESMGESINQVKRCITKVAGNLTETAGMTARFALVAYRDYGDRVRHEAFDFGDSATLSANLDTLKAAGGGDTSEDCFGGLWLAVNAMCWAAPARVIVWMGDAPQHGLQYNGGLDDSFPEGDPDGVTAEKIFSELQQKHIILVFGHLNEHTNAMIAQLQREIVPFGSNLFLTYNCGTDMDDFLTSTLHKTVSMTAAHGYHQHRGKEKPLSLVKVSWDLSTLWSTEEAGEVITLEAYNGGDLHPLLDLLVDGPNTKTRQITFRMTLNPVEKGEMRFAFYAIITEGRNWLFRKRVKKGMTKVSRYEGSHNSRKDLVNQAHIQAVATFLAKEFTLKLGKLGRKEKLVYVPVELLRVTGRMTGDNFFSLEPFIPGTYVKFNSNNGFVDKALEALHPLIQTFSHFTYSYSRGLLMVTDVQGVVEKEGNYTLTDPAVHTADPNNLRDLTNLGLEGMAAFFRTHVCNDFCRLLCLELPENLNAEIPIGPHLGATDAQAAEADREAVYHSFK